MRLTVVRLGRAVKVAAQNFGSLIRQWEKGELSLAEVLPACAMSKTTFYRRLREYRMPSKKQLLLSKAELFDSNKFSVGLMVKTTVLTSH
jgi:hypothetical protein